MEAGQTEEAVIMELLKLIAIAVVALLLLALIFFAVMAILAWSRTRTLTWRVQDLEDAVRRLQDERRLPPDLSGGSTAIRE